MVDVSNDALRTVVIGGLAVVAATLIFRFLAPFIGSRRRGETVADHVMRVETLPVQEQPAHCASYPSKATCVYRAVHGRNTAPQAALRSSTHEESSDVYRPQPGVEKAQLESTVPIQAVESRLRYHLSPRAERYSYADVQDEVHDEVARWEAREQPHGGDRGQDIDAPYRQGFVPG